MVKKKIQTRLLEIAFERKQTIVHHKWGYNVRLTTVRDFPSNLLYFLFNLFQKIWILRPLFNINLWPVEMNQIDTQLGTKVSSRVSWLNHIKTNNNMIQIS